MCFNFLSRTHRRTLGTHKAYSGRTLTHLTSESSFFLRLTHLFHVLFLVILIPQNVCLFVCLFVCLNKTRKTILHLLCWEGSKTPGSDHTRAEAQTTCIPKTAVHTTYVSIGARGGGGLQPDAAARPLVQSIGPE